MDDEERQHLEEMLEIYQRKLRLLERQAAKFGLHVPLDLQVEIDDTQNELKRVKMQIGRGNTQPRAPAIDQEDLHDLRQQALKAYFRKRDWRRTVDLLSQVAMYDPDDTNILSKLADARHQLLLQLDYRVVCDLRDEGLWQEAHDALSDLRKRAPDYPDTEGVESWIQGHMRRQELLSAARSAHGRKIWDETVDTLKRLLAEFPGDTEALAALEQAWVAQRTDTLEKMVSRAAEAYQQADWDRAISILNMVLVAESNHTAARTMLAAARSQQQHADIIKRRSGQPAAQTGMQLHYSAQTNVGRLANRNEDSYAVGEGEQTERLGTLLVVCDGMSSRESGEVASLLATETILVTYYSDESEDRPAILEQAFQAANAHIYQRGRGAMASTAVAGLMFQDALFIANVGDSRAYLIRDTEIRQISRDHSLVSDQLALGLITPDQARTSPDRLVVTRGLGYAADVTVDVFRLPLKRGDIVVLSSDGLHGLVTDDEIANTASRFSPDQATTRLVDLANRRGGTGNITVIIAQVEALAWDDDA